MMCPISLLSRSVVLRECSVSKLISLSVVVLHVGVVFVLRILRVTGFSKVGKSSAERKIMKILS